MAITTNSAYDTDHFERIDALISNRKHFGETVTKSFRVEEKMIRKLEQDARNKSVSLNAEINSILKKYVEWDMLASKVGMIPIARPIVSEIFQNMMTKEQIIELSYIAKNIIRETVQFMKGSLNLESFLSWLKARMEHCSQVNYSIDNINRQIRIIFKHDLGENWSLYNKLLTEHILDKILPRNNFEIEASSTTLMVSFKQPI